ncbi:retrovirus-related pol polyprotein from transposon TNT 1-94 [Tanacetum coccineum]
MDQTMAPVSISSGPCLSFATDVNAQVVPSSTSLSTTIAQDAPSTSASSPTSDSHLQDQHQEIREDTPTIHDVPIISHNLVTGDPVRHNHPFGECYEAGNQSKIILPSRSYSDDGPKIILDNIGWQSLLLEPKNFKMAVIEDCWFQAMQDEIHEFDRLKVWELVPRPIYVMVIALKWIYKVKLDEYGDVLKNKSSVSCKGISSGGRYHSHGSFVSERQRHVTNSYADADHGVVKIQEENSMAEQIVPAQPPTYMMSRLYNFFQALTASANVPAIYLQQFWKTMSYNEKTGVYSCQLDEQWFDLSADLLRNALAITPVKPTHPFELPPTGG